MNEENAPEECRNMEKLFPLIIAHTHTFPIEIMCTYVDIHRT